MSKLYQRLAIVVIVLGAMSGPALAAEEGLPDGRLIGYAEGKNEFTQPSTSTAWILLVGLGLVAIAPLFLNARRTHLD